MIFFQSEKAATAAMKYFEKKNDDDKDKEGQIASDVIKNFWWRHHHHFVPHWVDEKMGLKVKASFPPWKSFPAHQQLRSRWSSLEELEQAFAQAQEPGPKLWLTLNGA